MPIHEVVLGLSDGTNVEESKTERWEFKMTLGVKSKWVQYIGRGEVMEENVIVAIVLIWAAKERYLGRDDQCAKTWDWGLEWNVKDGAIHWTSSAERKISKAGIEVGCLQHNSGGWVQQGKHGQTCKWT